MNHFELSGAANSFGTSLLGHLGLQRKNTGLDAIILSPWGLCHVMGMLIEGAAPGSPSYQALHKALLPNSPPSSSLDTVRTSIQSLSSSIISSTGSKDLKVDDACSLWVKPDQELLEDYVITMKKYFNAEAELLTNASLVNSWVDRATRGKINSIIDEDMAREASLILLNAIYFLGKWETPFEKYSTMRYPFALLNGTQMDTQMMYTHQESGTFLQATQFQVPIAAQTTTDNNGNGTPPNNAYVDCVAVKMAYKGGKYSAIIAIPEGQLENNPEKGSSLKFKNGQDYAVALNACRETLVSSLAPIQDSSNDKDSEILQWQKVGTKDLEGIHLYLPRFEVEFQANLNDALEAAGLGPIFHGGDFTNLTTAGDLEVSSVVQKVYVKVDESGTEAAAVTAMVMQCMAMPFEEPPKEIYVRVDRPFVFSIVHQESGLALFVGEVYKPEVWKEEPQDSNENESSKFMPFFGR